MNKKFSFKNTRQADKFQFLCLLAVINYSHSQNSQVTWSSFNMSFAESKTSNIFVKSVIGQSFVGESQQPNTKIVCGLLAITLFIGIIIW